MHFRVDTSTPEPYNRTLHCSTCERGEEEGGGLRLLGRLRGPVPRFDGVQVHQRLPLRPRQHGERHQAGRQRLRGPRRVPKRIHWRPRLCSSRRSGGGACCRCLEPPLRALLPRSMRVWDGWGSDRRVLCAMPWTLGRRQNPVLCSCCTTMCDLPSLGRGHCTLFST